MSLGSVYSALTAEGGVDCESGVAFGPHARHKLDVYRPKAGAFQPLIVVFFYGGGWREGERAAYGFVGTTLAARGFTTVVPDYRLFPEASFPQFQQDAALAYAWVARKLVAERGPQCRIVLFGHSAGAHIAALLALDASYIGEAGADVPRPAAFIGLAGPYAFDPTTWPSTKAIFANVAGKPDSARPVAFARARAPAALLMHGLADQTVKLWNARELREALGALGNAAELITYPSLGHAGLLLALSRPLRWRAPVLVDILAFLAQQNETHFGSSGA